MKILLINPPNCGRSIPEEHYGISSLKQIFKGEPLALTTLAGNLDFHEVKILDLKADPGNFQDALTHFAPDLVGFTAMTCEAKTVLLLAAEAKETCNPMVVVGGVHASNDPDFFNHPEIDFIAIGLGKQSFRELVDALEAGDPLPQIAGITPTSPGKPLKWKERSLSTTDLVASKPPRYDLVASYRSHYTLTTLGLEMGFVASAFGCPFDCSFCCIGPLTGGRYLSQTIDTVVRDIQLLENIPVVRLVDANTFGNPHQALQLARAIQNAGIRKHFIADVRSDTVVRHPELIQAWKDIGLRAVIIGFEEVSDRALAGLNKANSVSINRDAVSVLRDIGVTIVGDYIVSPEYDEESFDYLARYLEENPVDLPMLSVLTPLPGTALFSQMKNNIIVDDLDFYTLTNAVTPTRLEEKRFYERYASLIQAGHSHARL